MTTTTSSGFVMSGTAAASITAEILLEDDEMQAATEAERAFARSASQTWPLDASSPGREGAEPQSKRMKVVAHQS